MPKPIPFRINAETPLEKWRAETFWTKEPETLAWISSFRDDAVFYDVGANIGVYSLYCARAHRQAAVYAFEPHPENYRSLCRNVGLNRMKNVIPVFCALSDGIELGTFRFDSYESGTSCGTGTGRKMPHLQWIFCYSMNALVRQFSLPMPHHVKIDVDGAEGKIIEGMEVLLYERVLKSVLIEINDDREAIFDTFTRHGFSTDNRFNARRNHSRVRRGREGITAENVVFTR